MNYVGRFIWKGLLLFLMLIIPLCGGRLIYLIFTEFHYPNNETNIIALRVTPDIFQGSIESGGLKPKPLPQSPLSHNTDGGYEKKSVANDKLVFSDSFYKLLFSAVIVFLCLGLECVLFGEAAKEDKNKNSSQNS